MRKTVLAAFVLLFATLSFAQNIVHPYVTGSLNLMPPGYASTAFGIGGGVEVEQKHVVLDSFAGYDTGHKENDNTVDNYKGHDRFLRAFAGPKLGSYYVGVGGRWSQLSTTNYTKGGDAFSAGSWHPEVGAGHDWSSTLFMRTQLAYMFRASKEVTHYPDGTSCDGCGSGSHGVDITVWFPSPAKSGHLFAKMNIVLFSYHATITDPKNISLTNAQVDNKNVGDLTEFSVGVRF